MSHALTYGAPLWALAVAHLAVGIVSLAWSAAAIWHEVCE